MIVYLYVLQSDKDSGYYIGITGDLGKRLEKHNRGHVKSTKSRKPFKIIYTEKYNNFSDARGKEKELKSFKGGNKFKELIK